MSLVSLSRVEVVWAREEVGKYSRRMKGRWGSTRRLTPTWGRRRRGRRVRGRRRMRGVKLTTYPRVP